MRWYSPRDWIQEEADDTGKTGTTRAAVQMQNPMLRFSALNIGGFAFGRQRASGPHGLTALRNDRVVLPLDRAGF